MNNSRILINNLKIFQGINQNIINVLLILFGTLLLTISAKVQVPFWPVPMTMQTFVVFLIGSTYGVRLSFLTLVAYLIEGALGLPVFAAEESGRSVCLMGRAMKRMIEVSLESGVLSDFPKLISPDDAKTVPKRNLLLIVTGSQGERRAASAQLANGKYYRCNAGFE